MSIFRLSSKVFGSRTERTAKPQELGGCNEGFLTCNDLSTCQTIIDLQQQIDDINDYEIEALYFTEINSSAGTITIPTGATIQLDQLPGGVDAFVNTIEGGQPTGTFPSDTSGTFVDVSSFDAAGNFVLSGNPSSYPCALVFVIKIAVSDLQNLNQNNVIDFWEPNQTPIVVSDFGSNVPENGVTVCGYIGQHWINTITGECYISTGTNTWERVTDVAFFFCKSTVNVGRAVAFVNGGIRNCDPTVSANYGHVIGVAKQSGNLGDVVSVQLTGKLGGFSGLTDGDKLFIGASGVLVTTNVISGISQQIAIARSSTEIEINIGVPILKP